MFAATLAHNTQRTGDFTFDGRRFMLRRGLTAALRVGRWNTERLREMASKYGTKATLAWVDRSIAASAVTI